MKNKKILVFAAVLLAVVSSVLLVIMFDKRLDINGDNATYIRLARNMAEGHGYSNLTPDGYQPASHFPPGYPVFLCGLIKLGMDSLVAFKIANGVLFVLSMLLLLWVIAESAGKIWLAFSALVLAAMNWNLLNFAGIAMSEMLYMFLTFLALFALFRYDRSGCGKFWKSPWFYVAVISVGLAGYTRSIALSMLCAIVVFFLVRKDWKASLASVCGYFLILLPWSIRNKMNGVHSRYIDTVLVSNPWRPETGTVASFGDFAKKILENINETMIAGGRDIVFPFLSDPITQIDPKGFVSIVVGIAILGTMIYGVFRTGRMKWTLFAYTAATYGICLLWHGGNGIRYLVPVLPLLAVFFYYGIVGLLELIIKRLRILRQDSLVYLAVLLMIIPMRFSLKLQYDQTHKPYYQGYEDYVAICEHIEKRFPKGSVVACRKPEIFNYYAPDMIGVLYPFTEDSEKFIQSLKDNRVDFIILDNMGYSSTLHYLGPVLKNNLDVFVPFYSLRNESSTKTFIIHTPFGIYSKYLTPQFCAAMASY